MSFSPSIQVRIEGAPKASGRIHQFRITTLQRMREAAQQRARESVVNMQVAMDAAYTSRSATGRAAASLSYRTQITGNGVDVSFQIGGFRETAFITALGGGYFQSFPVGPYPILPVSGPFLRVDFGDGDIAYLRHVTWGSETGGFESDVLADVGTAEGEAFKEDMLSVFDNAIAEMTVE